MRRRPLSSPTRPRRRDPVCCHFGHVAAAPDLAVRGTLSALKLVRISAVKPRRGCVAAVFIGALPPDNMWRLRGDDGDAWDRHRLHQREDRHCRSAHGLGSLSDDSLGGPGTGLGGARVTGGPLQLPALPRSRRGRSHPSPPRGAPDPGHRLPAHQGQSGQCRPGPPQPGARGPARGPDQAGAGHRHRGPAGGRTPGSPLRERVQSHRPGHRRAPSRRDHGVRDGWRDLQVHPPRDRRAVRPGGHRRLRHQRGLRCSPSRT